MSSAVVDTCRSSQTNAESLVDAAATGDFSRTVAREYERATGCLPSIYVCVAAQGASVEEP